MTTDENLSMTPDNDKAPQRRKRPRKGPIVGFLLLLFLLAGIGAGAWWYLFLRFEESTDDAYVAGNVLRIMPQVSGKVVAVDVDDNDMVAAGQTLVRLDPVDARLAYERSLVALASAVRDNCRLQAQLRETEAAIRMRRVDLRQKADNLTRREALGKAKAIGAEELKHARDDRENAAVALAAAEEERNALAAVLLDTGLAEQPAVRQAAANVRDCWLALQRTTVLSPAAGQIAKRGVQAGEVVSPGTPLMTVIPLHRLWIDANFKEVQLHKMRIGQPAVIRVDMYGGDVTYHGRVTGFSEEDLQMLWQAILNMFENDHSAARGKMAVRELIIFKHASELGNAASYKLFDAVTVKKVDGVAVPRKFSDYTVTVSEDLPEGVTCERLS